MKIRAKLTTLFLPAALLSVAVMAEFSRRAVQNVLVGEVETRALSIASTLAQSEAVADDLRTGDAEDLLTRLKMAQSGGASYGVAIDQQGRVVAHTSPGQAGRYYRDEATLSALRAQRITPRRRLSGETRMLDIAIPVFDRAGGERLGAIRVVFPIQDALKTAARISSAVIAIIAAVSGLALAAMLILAGRAIEPVRELAEAARRIERGRLGETVSVGYTDELGDLARSFNRMSRTLADTTIKREHLDNILESMMDGLLVTGEEGAIRRVNRSLVELLGWQESELLGVPASTLFYESGSTKPIERLTSLLSARTREAVMVSRSGERIPVQYAGSVVMDKQGRTEGYIFTVSDIRDRRRSEQVVAWQAGELARSNAELAQFAYVASHDLQEPLRKIITFGDRLRLQARGALDEIARECLDRMQSAATRMSKLIDDLLKLSRVSSQPEPMERIDLGEVAREALPDLEARISESGARIEIGPLPTIKGSRVQMRQLFQNLIGNALKFRKAKVPPVVIVSARSVGPTIEVSVQDNGIGFDEKYLDRIFQPFQRLHSRAEYEGTGMGLAIADRIVKRHGGSLTARSEPGVGSTFIATLPATLEREGPAITEAGRPGA